MDLETRNKCQTNLDTFYKKAIVKIHSRTQFAPLVQSLSKFSENILPGKKEETRSQIGQCSFSCPYKNHSNDIKENI